MGYWLRASSSSRFRWKTYVFQNYQFCIQGLIFSSKLTGASQKPWKSRGLLFPSCLYSRSNSHKEFLKTSSAMIGGISTLLLIVLQQTQSGLFFGIRLYYAVNIPSIMIIHHIFRESWFKYFFPSHYYGLFSKIGTYHSVFTSRIVP